MSTEESAKKHDDNYLPVFSIKNFIFTSNNCSDIPMRRVLLEIMLFSLPQTSTVESLTVY